MTEYKNKWERRNKIILTEEFPKIADTLPTSGRKIFSPTPSECGKGLVTLLTDNGKGKLVTLQ